MMNFYNTPMQWSGWGNMMGWGPGALWGWDSGGIFFLALIVWSLVWKGMALWKAAHHEHKWWFIALLLINTAGILDILYIYVFSKQKWSR